MKHFAFTATMARLCSYIYMWVEKDTNLQAWFADPDGNPIELMQISPGSPQHRVAAGQPAYD